MEAEKLAAKWRARREAELQGAAPQAVSTEEPSPSPEAEPPREA